MAAVEVEASAPAVALPAEPQCVLGADAIDACQCSVCLDIMKLAVITDCGHSFCKQCLQDARAANRGKCPLCRETVQRVMDNITLRQIIDRRQQPCPACHALVQQDKLAAHLDGCAERALHCSCGWHGTLGTRAQHPAECAALLLCRCGWAGAQADQRAHLGRCAIMVACPTCDTALSREELGDHACPQRATCECGWQGRLTDADAHYAQCAALRRSLQAGADEQPSLLRVPSWIQRMLDNHTDRDTVMLPHDATARTCPVCHTTMASMADYVGHVQLGAACASAFLLKRVDLTEDALARIISMGVTVGVTGLSCP